MKTSNIITSKFKELFTRTKVERKPVKSSNKLNLEHEDIIERLCNEGRVHQWHYSMGNMESAE